MGYIARWGPMGFVTSPTKIVPFTDFSTSVTLKTDSGDDSSGKSATNVRGHELQPMQFQTKYLRAAGVDPRKKYEEWAALVGSSYPLYIGSSRFGPAKMTLTSVSVSELLTDNQGNFLSVTLSLSLEESSTSQASTKKGTKTASKKSSSKKKAAETYAKTVEKKKAMQATASANDRNAKKLSAKEKRLG